MLESGTLRDKVEKTTAEAVRSGAQRSLPTEFEFVQDGGVRFLVRIVAHLADKQWPPTHPGGRSGKQPNPFLPYDLARHVADVSESHVCLLNKYNVVDQHLLIVTRQFEPQEARLNLEDFTALWTCMAEYDGLGFYNAGTIAGASQPHKHLQLVPLPLAPRGPRIPIEPVIESVNFQGQIGRASSLPFVHAVARVDPSLVRSPSQAARTMLTLYRAMMQAVELRAEVTHSDRVPEPYNLLVTRKWMLLVPRSCESFESISVNALGFAGALLVRNEQQMNVLKKHGPMTALGHVAAPRSYE